MQPLFTHNLLDLGVWLASLLIWRVMEVSVVAEQQGRELVEVRYEAGADVVCGTSLKATLDLFPEAWFISLKRHVRSVP